MKKVISLAILFILLAKTPWAQTLKGVSRIHYFYNSGWLVETAHHLLVFDFIPHREAGISFASLHKELQKGQAANKKLLIFISHDHQDHFNDSIFSFATNNRRPAFILGWKPAKTPAINDLTILSPGDSLLKKDFTVFTHPATDDGSAFLLKLDGLTIYHAGDHALWAEELLPEFTKQLQTIRNKTDEIDLAFVPAARGMFSKCAVDSTIEKGVQLTVFILQPKLTALQHIGCADKLFQYKQTGQKLAAINTHWMMPVAYNSAY